MKSRILGCTVSFCDWLKELSFLGHTMSLGFERLRHDAGVIRAMTPNGSQLNNVVMRELTKQFEHEEKIKRSFSPSRLIDGNVEVHRQSLSRLLLFETCAAYERWATEMEGVLILPAGLKDQLKSLKCKNIASAMQFPSTALCLVKALAEVAPRNSPPGLVPLREVFRKQIIRAKRKKNIDVSGFRAPVRFRFLLRDYLTIYRAHKELRNSLVHSSMKVSPTFENARQLYDNIRPESLGLIELPILIPKKSGETATVALRGVFGLMHVLELAAKIIDGYAN